MKITNIEMVPRKVACELCVLEVRQKFLENSPIC